MAHVLPHLNIHPSFSSPMYSCSLYVLKNQNRRIFLVFVLDCSYSDTLKVDFMEILSLKLWYTTHDSFLVFGSKDWFVLSLLP